MRLESLPIRGGLDMPTLAEVLRDGGYQGLYDQVANGAVSVSPAEFSQLFTGEDRGMSEGEFGLLSPETQSWARANPRQFMQQVLAHRNSANGDLLSVGAEGGYGNLGAIRPTSNGLDYSNAGYLDIHDDNGFLGLGDLGNIAALAALAYGGYGLMGGELDGLGGLAADESSAAAAAEFGGGGIESIAGFESAAPWAESISYSSPFSDGWQFGGTGMQSSTSTAVPGLGSNTAAAGLNAGGAGATSMASTIPSLAESLSSGLVNAGEFVPSSATTAAAMGASSSALPTWLRNLTQSRDALRALESLAITPTAGAANVGIPNMGSTSGITSNSGQASQNATGNQAQSQQLAQQLQTPVFPNIESQRPVKVSDLYPSAILNSQEPSSMQVMNMAGSTWNPQMLAAALRG